MDDSLKRVAGCGILYWWVGGDANLRPFSFRNGHEQYPPPTASEIKQWPPAGPGQSSQMCFNSLGCTPFAQSLAAPKHKQVVISGIETHVCVMQTELGACTMNSSLVSAPSGEMSFLDYSGKKQDIVERPSLELIAFPSGSQGFAP